ncbi:MAG: HPP family protein [Thermoprotei archaeon]
MSTRLWIHYFVQSFLATLAILVVLIILSLQNLVVVASIGASAFIVFTMPSSITAKPRNVIGGHVIGFTSGTLCWFIYETWLYSIEPLAKLVLYSLAVGLSILLMVITDTEHPPASGTALATVVNGFSWEVLVTLIVSTCVLSAIKHILKSYLKDLI